MSVWLRRQEIRNSEVRLLAQGLADMQPSQEGRQNIANLFQGFLRATMPFLADEQVSSDAKMLERVKKEAERGPLVFRVADENFLQKKARVMQVPDDFKQRLREGKRS